ncbi:antitoxin HicB [Paeniglutamicibacter gangotriensis]|uniref:HicB family protein n=2 Tax=Paeniglutamicibacter gangotriensis TaxID=254787 RepID=M7NMX2_9MICC|nr:hypothetical protein ADIAG_00961 [Paeniglutamicibacter gangotriensis Lz1y]
MATPEQTQAARYRYSVRWSPADGEFVASVAQFPSLSWLDSDRFRARAGIRRLVSAVLLDLAESGEPVPRL